MTDARSEFPGPFKSVQVVDDVRNEAFSRELYGRSIILGTIDRGSAFMMVSCVVKISDGSEVFSETLLRFRSLPRVGEIIVVNPGETQPRTGRVLSVVHSPAHEGIEGTIQLEVTLT